MGGWRRGAGFTTTVLLATLAAPVTATAGSGQETPPPGEPPRITARVLSGPVDWPTGWPVLDTPVVEQVTEHGQVLLPTTTDAGTATTGIWERGRIETVPNPPDMIPTTTALSGQDISNRGQVVGLYSVTEACWFEPPAEVRFACPVPFSWSDGELTRLPTPSGFGVAFDVNDRGQIAGRLAGSLESPPEAYGDVVWDRGEIVRPPGPHQVHMDENDAEINDRGQVLVEWMDGDEEHEGIWQVGGGITELDGGGVDTMLIDINDRGDIAGGTVDSDGPEASLHVVLWRDGEMLDLGDFGGSVWNVELTEGGQLLIEVSRPDGVHAVIWEDGEVTDLGALPTELSLEGMNDRGQVIAIRYGDGDNHSVLWQDSQWTDLPRPDGVEGDIVATDINNRGRIVGHVGTTPVMWTVHRRDLP
jgi:uncharacterized membrane protein